MLIKPLIKKAKVSVNSLPSNTSYSSNNHHPAYFGTEDEKRESLEIEGRLLMLPIMYREWEVIQNKKIHNGNCGISWSICDCQFAKKIRIEDLR